MASRPNSIDVKSVLGKESCVTVGPEDVHLLEACLVAAKCLLVRAWRSVLQDIDLGKNVNGSQYIFATLLREDVERLAHDRLSPVRQRTHPIRRAATTAVLAFAPAEDAKNTTCTVRREWELVDPFWMHANAVDSAVDVFGSKSLSTVKVASAGTKIADMAIAELHFRYSRSYDQAVEMENFTKKWAEGECPLRMLQAVFGGEAPEDLKRCVDTCVCSES